MIIKQIKRAIRKWWKEVGYRRQRAKRGWSVKDTWDIDRWFLDVMPQMLEYLKEHHMGFPGDLQKEYITAHCEELNMTYEEYLIWPSDKDSDGRKRREEIDTTCDRLWVEILDYMIFLLKEANEDTCTVENLNEKDNQRIIKEFSKKYSELGKSLLKPEDNRSDSSRKLYTLFDVPEYKETVELWLKKVIDINEYRNRCKTEAINLFNKWFWCLWD